MAVTSMGAMVAFIGAIHPDDLAVGGWRRLHFSGINGPFAALAAAVGAGWLAVQYQRDGETLAAEQVGMLQQ